jgi:hypothetical protein
LLLYYKSKIDEFQKKFKINRKLQNQNCEITKLNRIGWICCLITFNTVEFQYCDEVQTVDIWIISSVLYHSAAQLEPLLTYLLDWVTAILTFLIFSFAFVLRIQNWWISKEFNRSSKLAESWKIEFARSQNWTELNEFVV